MKYQPLKYGARKPYLEFRDHEHFYIALGLLARSVELFVCKLVCEHNEDQGAWAEEYRIQIYQHNEIFKDIFGSKVTAGVNSILGRINNNQYVKEISNNNNINQKEPFDSTLVRNTVPKMFIEAYDYGYALI